MEAAMTPTRRRTLELARVDVQERMHRTRTPALRQMLKQSLDEIEKQLKE
jgi:hypothetical protein